MDYTELTPDQMYRTVQQRLVQLEQQHLLATVNAAAANAAGETAQADALERQAEQWDASAGAVRAILAGMTPPEPAERERPPRLERPTPISRP